MVSDYKKCISNDWVYRENKEGESICIHLPHTNKETPYHYFDEKIYQFTSYYEKKLFIPQEKKRHFISFDGVMTAFKLFLNEALVGEYKGGYIPHHIEITSFVKQGEENKISVEVDSGEREDIPPFGYVIDYLTFGGIYRDAWLYSVDKTYIKNVFFKYSVEKHDGKTGVVRCVPIIQIDHEGEPKEALIKINIAGHEEEVKIDLETGVKKYDIPAFMLEDITLWDIDNPERYTCKISLVEELAKDEATLQVGFREIHIEADKLLLNGRNVTLFGLNRHQSYPYVGCAMPKRVQEQDAILLKNELGLNTARTSHYPQSPYFLDKCDEIGLLVMEEIPGWQYVSQKEEWREQVLKDVQGMIERDYNHPSILTWGVRINESLDDHALYEKTNQLARELDDTRLTSGVRCIERSELLEDIYTMNDFIHDGTENILRTRERCTGLDKPVPYIVTEFCGHIYPTKKFDQEARIVEHALRHGRVQSLAKQKEEVLGAVGWCAFDYNTHFDFGSGDRICYHGVMDMFRIPKFAGALYKSQRNPKLGYVIEPLTYWARGERDKGNVFPIHVCSNCDTIEVILGGVSKGKFSRQFYNTDAKMQYLPYPPFVLQMANGEWGAHWTDAEFIGYAKGEKVVTKRFAANPFYSGLDAMIDDEEIRASAFDATRVVVKTIDQEGNVLPYLNEGICVETQGDIEVIGPKRLSLIGGSIGFWVRSSVGATKGEGSIKITSNGGYEKTLKVRLID